MSWMVEERAVMKQIQHNFYQESVFLGRHGDSTPYQAFFCILGALAPRKTLFPQNTKTVCYRSTYAVQENKSPVC